MATPVADAIPETGNLQLDGLVQGGQWQFGGGPRVLTYSFSIETELGIPWTEAFKDAVQLALAQYAAVADISFEEVAPDSDVDFSPADMAFALTGNTLSQLTGGAIGLGFFPDPVASDALLASIGNTPETYPNPEGDVYFDSGHLLFAHLAPGGAGFEVILHEIGHALGLKHPFDQGSNERPVVALDPEKTVMDGGAVAFPFDRGHAGTPLVYDVAAIQHIYGANMSTGAGDDVYVLVADGASRVIWDAGGMDALDASAFGQGVALSLVSGAVNSLPGDTRITIALGAVIEKATGTAFVDILVGNDADNFIEGGGGGDSLNGGAGTDTLAGGSGNDFYDLIDDDVIVEAAGGGIDTVRSFAPSATMPEHVENAFVELAQDGTRIAGSAQDNSITGNAFANSLEGGRGNDTLNGLDGDDTLSGGAGIDRLVGGAGNDVYFLGVGDVVVDSGGIDSALSESTLGAGHVLEEAMLLDIAGNASIAGTPAANHFVGNDGANLIEGGGGNDSMEGGRGDDTLIGGAGDDHLDGGRGADRMEGGAGNDYFIVSATRDEVVELASAGTDTVEVHAARYAMPANVENAVLAREGGAIVIGNEAANRFIFDREGGVDRILGFESGKDRILFDDAVFTEGIGAGLYDEATGALYYDGVQLAGIGEIGDPSDLGPGDFGLV
jgi:serralysin